jgi:raffinose/stachyose/melibiose transport system permease protein
VARAAVLTRRRAAEPSARRRRRPWSSGPLGRRGYLIYLVPSLVLFLGVIAVPFVMNVYFSLTAWSGVGTPRWIGLDNYRTLLSDSTFAASFRNNLALIVAMVIVPTLIGLLLAAALFDHVARRFSRRTASTLRAGFYLPQLLPIAVAGIIWGWILHPSGALNSLLDGAGLGSLSQNWLGDPQTALPSVMLMMVWFQIGYPTVIFMAGIQRVDPELYEAAEIDGASWFQRFSGITVRLIRPELFVVLLTTTIASLKVFAQIFVLTRGGPGDATLVPSYFSYQNFFEKANVGYGSAIATVLTVIIIMLTAVFLRVQQRGEA